MKRYQEAGINPYAALGNISSGTQSSAGSAPSYPSTSATKGVAGAKMAEMFNYLQIKQAQSLIRLNEAKEERERSLTAGQNIQNRINERSEDTQVQYFDVKLSALKGQVDLNGQTYSLRELDYTAKEIQNYILQLTKDYKISSERLENELKQLQIDLGKQQYAQNEKVNPLAIKQLAENIGQTRLHSETLAMQCQYIASQICNLDVDTLRKTALLDTLGNEIDALNARFTYSQSLDKLNVNNKYIQTKLLGLEYLLNIDTFNEKVKQAGLKTIQDYFNIHHTKEDIDLLRTKDVKAWYDIFNPLDDIPAIIPFIP